MGPSRRRTVKWVASILVVAAMVVAPMLLFSTQHLEVYRWDTAEPLLFVRSASGTEFALWFLHSYDRAFFQEHYRVEDGGRMLLTGMSFKSCLNGQGFEQGTYRTRPDGSAELYGIDMEMREICFRLGSPDLANHTLIIGNRRIPLLDYAEAGTLIGIRPVEMPLWRSLFANAAAPRESARRVAVRRADPSSQEAADPGAPAPGL